MKYLLLIILTSCSSTVGYYDCVVSTNGVRWAELTVYARSLQDANDEVYKVIRDSKEEASFPEGEHIIQCF